MSTGCVGLRGQKEAPQYVRRQKTHSTSTLWGLYKSMYPLLICSGQCNNAQVMSFDGCFLKVSVGGLM